MSSIKPPSGLTAQLKRRLQPLGYEVQGAWKKIPDSPVKLWVTTVIKGGRYVSIAHENDKRLSKAKMAQMCVKILDAFNQTAPKEGE